MINLETLTSSDLAGLVIRWGLHPSSFGPCMIAITPRGVCWLAFVGVKTQAEVLAELEHQWRGATIVEDTAATAQAAQAALAALASEGHGEFRHSLDLVVSGTDFQVDVWRALLEIPAGETTSYSHLAETVGRPKAAPHPSDFRRSREPACGSCR